MIYPFACKVEDLNLTHVPGYDAKQKSFHKYCQAFYQASITLSGRDVVEEALPAGVWPLSWGGEGGVLSGKKK